MPDASWALNVIDLFCLYRNTETIYVLRNTTKFQWVENDCFYIEKWSLKVSISSVEWCFFTRYWRTSPFVDFHKCRKNGMMVQWKGIFNLINILVISDGNAIADLQHNFRITLDSFGHKWKPIAHDQTSKKGLRQVCICPRCRSVWPDFSQYTNRHKVMYLELKKLWFIF